MQNPWKINASTRLAMPFILSNPRGEQVSHWERRAGHNARTTKDSISPMDQVLLHGEVPIYAKEIHKPTNSSILILPRLFFNFFFPKQIKSWHTTRQFTAECDFTELSDRQAHLSFPKVLSEVWGTNHKTSNIKVSVK